MGKDLRNSVSSGDAGAETSSIEASASPGSFKRMTAARKQSAVLRLLRGESLDILTRELRVTAADLSDWRDKFLAAGEAGLKSPSRDGRDAEISRLKSKVGGLTMDNELLVERISRMETLRPFVQRRSKT
jgi:transposase